MSEALSLLIFVPLLGALLAVALPRQGRLIGLVSVAVMAGSAAWLLPAVWQ